MTTLLVTGFGPFPGAPYNPTGPLIARLAKLRRPALAGVTIVPHVFTTSYATVDKELPALIAHYKPDALLMFGLAGRAKWVRIETRARNALAMLPDATNASLRRQVIAPGGPAALAMPVPARHLLAAARDACVRVKLSRDAGRYLCNYLCWNAADVVARAQGPRLAAFIHVPPVSRTPRRRRADAAGFTLDELTRAGTRILIAMAAAARR
jgi:pyroglutamyl-peptidase